MATHELVIWDEGICGWSSDGYGEPCEGTETECEEAARQLWTLGEDWPEARFGVRDLEDDSVVEVEKP